LDALSTHFPSYQQSIQATGNRPVYFQIDISDTSLFQLETRPSGGGSGCFPAGLELTKGVRQPTIVLNQQGTEPGTPPASSNSTGMEGPGTLEMLWDFPRLVAPAPDLIQKPLGFRLELIPQLALWPVSGKGSLTTAFLLNF